jgi:hypothetical protein
VEKNKSTFPPLALQRSMLAHMIAQAIGRQ